MKISVALCTYNGEKYIGEQIQSILEQSKKPDEIILCDDGSIDKTVVIAKSILEYSGIRHRIEVNATNLGVVKNFQKAISLTSGDIIFLSDQDDVWNKEKIEAIMEEFEKDKSCIMVFSDADLVNENRRKMGVKLWSTLNFSIKEFESESFLSILLKRCVVTGATMAIKRELFNYTIPFPDSWLHDGWLAINASVYGRVRAIDKPLIEYRQHGNNVIGAMKLNSIARLRKYIKHISILEHEREIRVNRYNMFYRFNSNKLDQDIKNKVLECIKFWADMKKLKEFNLCKGIIIILSNLRNGNYKKYYTGIRGAIRDIAYLFLKKAEIQ